MATRKLRSRSKKPLLNKLDQFKHAADDESDVDMSDSQKNAQNDNEVSSADSASEYEEEDLPESESEDESEADSAETEESDDSRSGSEDDASSSEEEESENEVDHSSDSDFVPGKSRKKKKKKKPAKKVVKRRPQRQSRKKRKLSESEEEESSESPSDDSGSDGDYRPQGTRRSTRSRTKKTTASTSMETSVGSRRSTRHLGRKQVKYDDRSIYGEIEGLYESDGKESENRKKLYKNVAKKRQRGGIKKMPASAKKKSNSKSNSNSLSPNSRKRIKLTLNKNKKTKSNKMKDEISSEEGESSKGPSSQSVPKAPLFTYTSWLDDVISETVCKYSSRGRTFHALVTNVEYHVQVQTDLGMEDFTVGDQRIKASDKPRDDDKMDVDGAESNTNSNTEPAKEWYQKLKIGDYVHCLIDNDGDESWTDCKVVFINRRFDIQYNMRRSQHHDNIWEYKDDRPNPELRARLRPCDGVAIEDTPPPQSESTSPIKKGKSSKASKKKKKSRFGDSEDEDSESESEEDSDLNDDLNTTSNSVSISPVDALVTKIELILFRLHLPRGTVHWRDTFKHLMPSDGDTNTDTTTNTMGSTNIKASGKMEMDIDDEDKENSGDHPNSGLLAPPTPSEKTADKLVMKYLCKYTNKSYHHLEWLTARELRAVEAEVKMKNFNNKFSEHDRHVMQVRTAISLQKYSTALSYFFNDLYLQIDRLVSYAEPGETFDTISGTASSSKQFQINVNDSEETLYLVKWRGMEYDEATWELESFLKEKEFDEKYHGTEEIHLLLKRQEIPDNKILHPQPRKLNKNYFINRSATKHRVEDGQIFKGGRKLRGDYQRDGVNWLLNNWQGRRGCILADEMGLGKTVQTVTFVNYLFTHYKQWGPFLVVAPLSTLAHWAREFRAWSDMNVIVYYGSQSSRERIVVEEFDWLWTNDKHERARTAADLKKLNANNFKFNVMVTTKEVVNRDTNILNASKIHWNTIIVDEAHSLKSNRSLFYRELQTFKNPYTHTVFLTGTPIQNNMAELWCLLHFLSPETFDDQEAFIQKYSNLAESRDEMKAMLRGRLLQRLKYLVEKSLGQREEKIIWVELTLFQKKWYKALYQRSYAKLKACGAGKMSMMNVSMQLRKCCNHPFLMEGVEKTMSPPGTDDITVNENLIKSCGKFVLLDKLLPKLKAEGHRVLIFSQMSNLLDILEDYFNYRQHLYERLDGSVTGVARFEAIDRFQNDESIFAFMLTTKAGGVGITLTKADTVIIFDSDWNPMNDVQAIARSHRIGQKKKVSVYRLLTRNSYEENMFKRADQKLALNKVVMGDEKDIKKADLDTMLKKGAISMFLQDAQTDADIKKFADASIDDILSKRTEVITHDAEQANNPEGAMFSEAVFLANADDADVNVDDENFWERLGIAKEEEEQRFTSPFARRRRTRFSTRTDSASQSLYDSDGYSMEEFEDQGTSLLGAMSYIVYGRWQQMFDDLSVEEKQYLGIEHKEEENKDDDDDDDNKMDEDTNDGDTTNSNTNTNTSTNTNIDTTTTTTTTDPIGDDLKEKKTKTTSDEKSEEDYVPPPADSSSPTKATPIVSKPIEQWQIDILRESVVETICRMINLMRPDMRNQKLGNNLSKLVTMLYDKEFRNDVLYTLSLQIYSQNIETLQPEAWKDLVAKSIKDQEMKNRFVDTLQLQRRPGLCRMGCYRLCDPNPIVDDEGNVTDRRYDTCCKSCAIWKADSPPKDGKKKTTSKEPLHDLRCDRRHYEDWRKQIRDEAMKAYLKAHPLEQIPIPRDPEQEEKAESVAAPKTRYAIPERRHIQGDLVDFIAEELKYHPPTVLVSAMSTRYINNKSLREQLRKMEHGSIVELLVEKFERMFKFKVMLSLAENDVSKLELSTYANPKSFPEWWSLEWTKCLLDGTMKNGWSNVPREFAMENYGFTTHYKGPKKLSKKEQEEKKRLEAVQKLMGNVEITNGASSSSTSISGTTTPAEPVLIVKKRQWVQEGPIQQKMMISICNHQPLKKGVSEAIKKMKAEIKKINEERKKRENGPSKAMLKQQELEKAKKAALKAEKEKRKQEKQERKRERKERKEMEKMMRNKDSATGTGSSQFNDVNNITNYFSASLKNMPAGTRNAFDLLGKKPPLTKEEEKARKKKKKAKQLKRAKEALKLDIQFDEKGNFKVPIKLSKTALIKSLGTICLDEGYHGLNVISPLGYTVCHSKLPSFKRPGKTTVFTTTIKRGVDGPLFEVTCCDDTDFKVQGKSASGVWTELRRMWLELEDGANEHNQKMTDAILNHKSPTASPQKDGNTNTNTNTTTNSKDGVKSTSSSPSKKKVASVSGLRKIGLADVDIRRVIECMPNAKNCKNYKWKYRTKFEENEKWTPKKAFERTLKRDKNGDKRKRKSKSKSPHKSKKRKKNKSPTKIINNVNNINLICIENNIVNNAMSNGMSTAVPQSSGGIPNMQPNVGHHPHPMSSGSDPKNNVIVIEDSPSVSASVPARMVSVSPQKKSDALSGTLNRVNLDLPSRSQSTLSEVIDLCESDNESKDTKKSRKRKHPSGEEVGAGSDDSDIPTKKRKVEGM